MSRAATTCSHFCPRTVPVKSCTMSTIKKRDRQWNSRQLWTLSPKKKEDCLVLQQSLFLYDMADHSGFNRPHPSYDTWMFHPTEGFFCDCSSSAVCFFPLSSSAISSVFEVWISTKPSVTEVIHCALVKTQDERAWWDLTGHLNGNRRRRAWASGVISLPSPPFVFLSLLTSSFGFPLLQSFTGLLLSRSAMCFGVARLKKNPFYYHSISSFSFAPKLLLPSFTPQSSKTRPDVRNPPSVAAHTQQLKNFKQQNKTMVVVIKAEFGFRRWGAADSCFRAYFCLWGFKA